MYSVSNKAQKKTGRSKLVRGKRHLSNIRTLVKGSVAVGDESDDENEGDRCATSLCYKEGINCSAPQHMIIPRHLSELPQTHKST